MNAADRKETCWHEAAHAVLTRKLCRAGGAAGLLDGNANPIFSPEHEPLLRKANGYAFTAGARTLDGVLVNLAGAAAVEELLYQPAIGCEDDIDKADQLLADLGYRGIAITLMRGTMMTLARDVVRRHRQAIRRVARALRVHGQLSGEQIDQLMEA
jgi:hypothetical protein